MSVNLNPNNNSNSVNPLPGRRRSSSMSSGSAHPVGSLRRVASASSITSMNQANFIPPAVTKKGCCSRIGQAFKTIGLLILEVLSCLFRWKHYDGWINRNKSINPPNPVNFNRENNPQPADQNDKSQEQPVDGDNSAPSSPTHNSTSFLSEFFNASSEFNHFPMGDDVFVQIENNQKSVSEGEDDSVPRSPNNNSISSSSDEFFLDASEFNHFPMGDDVFVQMENNQESVSEGEDDAVPSSPNNSISSSGDEFFVDSDDLVTSEVVEELDLRDSQEESQDHSQGLSVEVKRVNLVLDGKPLQVIHGDMAWRQGEGNLYVEVNGSYRLGGELMEGKFVYEIPLTESRKEPVEDSLHKGLLAIEDKVPAQVDLLWNVISQVMQQANLVVSFQHPTIPEDYSDFLNKPIDVPSNKPKLLAILDRKVEVFTPSTSSAKLRKDPGEDRTSKRLLAIKDSVPSQVDILWNVTNQLMQQENLVVPSQLPTIPEDYSDFLNKPIDAPSNKPKLLAILDRKVEVLSPSTSSNEEIDETSVESFIPVQESVRGSEIEIALESQPLDEEILSLWTEWRDDEEETEEIFGNTSWFSEKESSSLSSSSFSGVWIEEPGSPDKRFTHPEMHFFFYNKAPGKFEDGDKVAFQKGQIVKVELAFQTPALGNDLFYLLKNTYGVRLATFAFTRYGLNPESTVTWKDIKAVLVGVSLYAQKSDLQQLFEQLKQGKTEMSCVHYVSDRDRKAICRAQQFEELDGKQMKLLLDAFRTLPFKQEEGVVKKGSVTEVLFEGKSLKNAELNAYCYDQSLLCTFEMLKDINTNPETLRLALAEQMNKELVYQDLQKGMLVPLLDSKGELAYFEVLSVRNPGDGLVVAVLRQMSRSSEVTKDHPFPIRVAFRGTDSLQGWNRNFDPKGVGRTLYEQHEKEIISMVQEALDNTPGDYTSIEIGGHSLAGADAQRNQMTLIHHLSEINISKALFYMFDKVSKGGTGYALNEMIKLLKEIPDLSKLVTNANAFANDENKSSTDQMKKLYDWMADHKEQYQIPFTQGCQEILKALNTASQVQLRSALLITEIGKSEDKEKALQDAIKRTEASSNEKEKLVAAELKKVIKVDSNLIAQYEARASFYKGLYARGEALLAKKTKTVLDLEQFERLKSLFTSRKAFDKVVEISNYNWNSPALEKETNEKYKAGIQVLEWMKPELKISFTYGRYLRDIVQETGEIFIGYEVHSPILEKRIIELSNDTENKDLGAIGPHTAKAFTKSLKGKFKMRDLSGAELELYLGKNWHWKEGSSHMKWYMDYVRRGVQVSNQALWLKPVMGLLSSRFKDPRQSFQAKNNNSQV